LRFTYTSSHTVQGINQAADGAKELLVDSPEQGVRVTLPRDPHAALRRVTRAKALLNMMADGKLAPPLPDDFKDTLLRYMTDIENFRRSKIKGHEAVVVVEVIGDIDVAFDKYYREIDDFALAYDAVNKDSLRAMARPKVSAALVGLRMGTAVPCRFETIDTGIYLSDAEGKTVYPFTFEVGAVDVYTSGPLRDDQFDEAATFTALTIESASLQRPIHLHAQALGEQKDKVRAFLDAWNALEILIRKIFPYYRDKLSDELRGVSDAPGLHSYLERVAEIMKDKHSLLNDFEVVSVYLDHEKGQHDLDQFKRLKKIRNDLMNRPGISGDFIS